MWIACESHVIYMLTVCEARRTLIISHVKILVRVRKMIILHVSRMRIT